MHSPKRDSIWREAEASLKRLRIDVIDLYQIQWPIPEPDIEDGWAAFAELALAAGEQLRIPLPTASRADEILEAAGRLGYERQHIASLFAVLRQIADDSSQAG